MASSILAKKGKGVGKATHDRRSSSGAYKISYIWTNIGITYFFYKPTRSLRSL
jgi:hypothetical protein